MVKRAEFKILEIVSNKESQSNCWVETGKASILISDLKRADIQSYSDHHEIIWLSPVDGKCAHRLNVKEDPMKFINSPEGE